MHNSCGSFIMRVERSTGGGTYYCFFRGGAVLFPTLASVVEPTSVVSGETRPGGSVRH